MKVSLNVNDSVKVKLTKHGLSVMEKNWDAVLLGFPKAGAFMQPKTDENGYSKFQLWELFQEFGSETGMCKELCFETEIILAD